MQKSGNFRVAGKVDLAHVVQADNAGQVSGAFGYKQRRIISRGWFILNSHHAIGFLTDAPLGIPDFLNGIKNADKEFYLVSQPDKQFFVIVTDEFMESRWLAEKITDKKFAIGNFLFVDCGIVFQ